MRISDWSSDVCSSDLGIGAAILQLIGANLVQQANAATFLAQVKQHAAAFAGNGLQRGFKLRTAIAALAEQGIARQAFGVQARSEERRVGKEWGRTCRSRWWQDP